MTLSAGSSPRAGDGHRGHATPPLKVTYPVRPAGKSRYQQNALHHPDRPQGGPTQATSLIAPSKSHLRRGAGQPESVGTPGCRPAVT